MEKEKKSGPAPKLTHKLVEQIADGVRIGMSKTAIGQLIGFSRQTFYNWYDHGEADRAAGKTRTIFYKFVVAVDAAQAECYQQAAKAIDDAIKGGQVEETRKEVEENGEVIRVETTHKILPPDTNAAFKRLALQDPTRWVQTQKINMQVDWRDKVEKEGRDPETHKQQIAELVSLYREGIQDTGDEEDADSASEPAA